MSKAPSCGRAPAGERRGCQVPSWRILPAHPRGCAGRRPRLAQGAPAGGGAVAQASGVVGSDSFGEGGRHGESSAHERLIARPVAVVAGPQLAPRTWLARSIAGARHARNVRPARVHLLRTRMAAGVDGPHGPLGTSRRGMLGYEQHTGEPDRGGIEGRALPRGLLPFKGRSVGRLRPSQLTRRSQERSD